MLHSGARVIMVLVPAPIALCKAIIAASSYCQDKLGFNEYKTLVGVLVLSKAPINETSLELVSRELRSCIELAHHYSLHS